MIYDESKKLIFIYSAFAASIQSSYLLRIKIFNEYDKLIVYKNFLLQKDFKVNVGSMGGVIFLEIDCDIKDLQNLLQEQDSLKDDLIHELKRAWENYRKASWDIEAPKNKIQLKAGLPLIMGILNITPDSFYDGGRYLDKDAAIEQAFQLQEEGADIIDIGGQSTRPGSAPITPEEEIARIMPVFSALQNKITIPISVDTYCSKVADLALQTGADIVNDTSALTLDEGMFEVIKKHHAPVIIMHFQESLQPMPQEPYYGDVAYDISIWLKRRIEALIKAGIQNYSILIDPGIGFGKAVEHNLEIFNRLDAFRCLGYPITVGPSRKSFIGKIVPDQGPQDRLDGTISACVLALLKGASILRVHDVKAVKNALEIAKGIIKGV